MTPHAPTDDRTGAPAAPPAPAEALDWRDIPVFVVNRNRFGALRRLVDWLCAAGTRRVVIMDNASDFPPLLRYYEELPNGVKVMRLAENHGPYVLWQQGVHHVLDTPYVVSDSDVVPADSCPADLIAVLLDRLRRWPDAKKIGMGLRIDNLPDSYGEVDTVRKWESQFWEHPIAPGAFAAPVDTTFAIYPARSEFSNEPCNVRLGHPYVAEHTPWYVDESGLDVEERYYREHTSKVFSNWSVANKDSWVKKSERVAGFAERAKVLHLDGGREYIPGWINAGCGEGRFDIAFDVGRCRTNPLPLAADTLDGIHLSHVLEGVADAEALFDELHRVAKPGARLHLRVAHGARGGAWADAGQRRAWSEGSFAHLAQPVRVAGAGSYRGDWQVQALRLVAPAGIATARSQFPQTPSPVQEMIVTLTAIKPARARAGRQPAPQHAPEWLTDERVDPGFQVIRTTDNRPPVRLGLPWWMPHYQPLNGAHPLALAYVDGNRAIETVRLGAMADLQAEQLQAVLLAFTEQARPLAPASTPLLIEWLNFQDQLAMESQSARYDVLMLHTTPLYAGTRPFVFHFESFPTLFMPFMFHGACAGIEVKAQPWFGLVRSTLESPRCKAIYSHMRDSLRILNDVFASPIIAAKCHHVPLALAPPRRAEPLAKFDSPGPLRILFTNSFHNDPRSFYLRGGHHLLSAFARLRRQLPDARLTLLSAAPADLTARFAPADMDGVRWIQVRVDDAELEQLYLDHHVFALPAAGLHSASLLRAFSHGCVPIVPDSPGYDEYTQAVSDSVLTVRGVRALVYRDEPEGWISDRFSEFIEPREDFAAQIHALLLESCHLPRLREMAARNLEHGERHHTLARAQAGLNRVLAGILTDVARSTIVFLMPN